MRSLPCTLLCTIVLAAPVCAAQQQNKSEAQQDGLFGPVKSVLTTRQPGAAARSALPSGPTLVVPAWCQVCDYDREGYRSRSGDIVDGKFIGDLIANVRDETGQLISRRYVDAASREVIREERIGPFGPTEMDAWSHQKHISHQVFHYDENGHQSEWLTWDGAGNSTGRVVTVSTRNGVEISNSTWSGDGTLLWQHTYDPESDTDAMESREQSGAPGLSRTFQHGHVASFWEPSDATNRFGQRFAADHTNGNVDTYDCHRSTGCEIAHVHYEYAGPGTLNPLSVEWRDSEGKLEWATYYQYEFDTHRNWTGRKIWLVSPEQRQRTLYEEDHRTITYWTHD